MFKVAITLAKKRLENDVVLFDGFQIKAFSIIITKFELQTRNTVIIIAAADKSNRLA